MLAQRLKNVPTINYALKSDPSLRLEPEVHAFLKIYADPEYGDDADPPPVAAPTRTSSRPTW